MSCYYPTGALRYNVIYKYDTIGNMIEDAEYTPSGFLKAIIEYQYTYYE